MKFLNDFSIKKRIFSVFGIILLLIITVVIYNYISLNKSKGYSINHNVSLLSIEVLIEADRDLYQSSLAISNSLIDTAITDENLDNNIVDIEENLKQTHERYDKFYNDFALKNNEEYKSLHSDFNKNLLLIQKTTDELCVLLKSRNFEKAKELYQKSYQPVFKPLRSILNDFTDVHLESSQIGFNENLNLINNIILFSTILSIIAIVIFTIIAFTLYESINNPINKLKELINDLSKGKLSSSTIEGKDEIYEVGKCMDQLSDGLRNTSEFAKQVGMGNFSHPFSPLSDEDTLGNSLLQMKDDLRKSAEAEQRRNWINIGLTKLAELIRIQSSSTENYYSSLLSFLINYLKVNQGSLFILEHDEQENYDYLNLVAAYAYDRKKFITKKINVGDGLVGQSVLEKEMIFLTDVPKNYVSITSGLGQANPTNVIILPLVNNEVVYGVLELASFHVLEEHEISFLQKSSEAISSSISTIIINDNTKKMLAQSQIMTEELRSQEEELKQNFEEMASIQETVEKQLQESNNLKTELEIREKVFGETTILSETDKFGNIIYANDKFCQVSKYSLEELIGKPQNIVRHPDMPKEIFNLMWSTIKQGKIFNGILKNKAKDGSTYWVDATIVPVYDKQGQFVKYIGARYHLKDENLAKKLYQDQLKNLNLDKEFTTDLG